ncbi:ZFP91 ligase, partial [Columbina picui]|nr:ZFP91 ligase [Columbina picui]
PKEEKEEEEICSVLGRGSPVGTGRPGRGWRSSRAARLRDTDGPRASRSRTGSLQLVCKSEPNTDQLEYGMWAAPARSGLELSAVPPSDDEEMLISEEEVPFKDDPRDETYKPHLEKEAPKQRRRASKGKEEKVKQKEIKVEVKEESEFREDEEPPRKRGRRRKDDKSPRLPKRRKKPPIQYVRCEMEGCGTVLAHPRYLQFSCNICGKKFEKKDSVVAHKAKSHPEVLIAEALAANAGALITSTDILGTNPEAIAPPTDGQGLPLLPDALGSAAPADCLLLSPDTVPKPFCGAAERVSLVADGKLFVGSGSSANPEGLVMNTEILGTATEVLIEDSGSAGP